MSDAARAVKLEDGVWCVDVFGHAFVNDPDTEDGAKAVAADLNKRALAYAAEQTAGLQQKLIDAEYLHLADEQSVRNLERVTAGLRAMLERVLMHRDTVKPVRDKICDEIRVLLADPEGQR